MFCFLFQHESETKETGPIPTRLFELKIVNHAGNADLRLLNYENTEPLRLSCRQYLCAEWYPKLKEKYFDMKAAEVWPFSLHFIYLFTYFLFLIKYLAHRCVQPIL